MVEHTLKFQAGRPGKNRNRADRIKVGEQDERGKKKTEQDDTSPATNIYQEVDKH